MGSVVVISGVTTIYAGDETNAIKDCQICDSTQKYFEVATGVTDPMVNGGGVAQRSAGLLAIGGAGAFGEIDVEMVLVGVVGFRAEHGAEDATGGGVSAAQEQHALLAGIGAAHRGW